MQYEQKLSQPMVMGSQAAQACSRAVGRSVGKSAAACRHLHVMLAVGKRPLQQLRQRPQVVGAEDDVQMRQGARAGFSPSRWPMQPPTATMRFSKGEPARRGTFL